MYVSGIAYVLGMNTVSVCTYAGVVPLMPRLRGGMAVWLPLASLASSSMSGLGMLQHSPTSGRLVQRRASGCRIVLCLAAILH